MKTLKEAADSVLRHLDDETEDVWTRSQVEDWLQDGYDTLCREATCLFDMVMFDRQPATGNHTREFEEDFMTDMPILGRFNFTRESERQYLPEQGMRGPMNHTNPDNANYMTVANEGPSVKTVNYLPDRFVEVDRVMHDWLRIYPRTSRNLRQTRSIYETEQGGVFTYNQDQDGFFAFRTIGVPVSTVNAVTISGTWGPIRAFTGTDFDWSEETVIAPEGGYGIIRQVPREFASGSHEFGAIRRVVEDTNATRVEYYRLGADLKRAPFEVPDRCVKYCEWYALHRAYSTPGEGEDMKMAQHYHQRFQVSVKRLVRRVQDVMKERTAGMGQRRQGQLDAYLERFPSNYGRKRPFRI